jgi:hypothetical protein
MGLTLVRIQARCEPSDDTLGSVVVRDDEPTGAAQVTSRLATVNRGPSREPGANVAPGCLFEPRLVGSS